MQKRPDAGFFQSVIFDMDGVIFDSEREVFYAWEEVARGKGITDISVPLRQCLGVTKKESEIILKKYYGDDFPYDTFAAEASVIYRGRTSGGRLPLKAGTRELLQALRDHHVPVALASSTRRETVERELTEAGLISYFQAIICGDMVKKSKPEPDIYLTACRALGAAPEESIAIEDSYNGIRSAAGGHLRPIMVPDLMEPTDEMRTLSEKIFPSLIDVRAYLFPEDS